MTFDASDPRWTAYVLSELDADEVAVVEKELQSSPEAREAVAGLRETAVMLGLALDTLPPLELSPDQRRVIRDAPRFDSTDGAAEPALSAPLAAVSGDRRVWRRLAFAGMTTGALGVAAVTLLLVQGLLGDRAWIRPVMGAGLLAVQAPAAHEPPEMRLEVTTPPTNTPASLAISPDGTAIVYVAMTQPFTATAQATVATGDSELWVRRLNAVSPRLLTKGNLTSLPFWSPDGRSIGFFADGKLKRINVDGGNQLVLADAPRARGGTWGPDGVILFAPDATSPILSIPATGGAPTSVTRVRPPQQKGHGLPMFLPDGNSFLFHVEGDPVERGIHAARLNSPETRRIVEAEAAAMHLPSGQLLFVRQRMLLAQRFDSATSKLTGSPSTVAENIIVEGDSGGAALSASGAGAIVFRASPASAGPQLNEAGAVAISPDGRWIAYQSNASGRSDIWIRSFQAPSEAVSPGSGRQPVWRADGREVFFIDRTGQTMSVRMKPGSDGKDMKFEAPTPLLPKTVESIVFSADGRRISFFSHQPIVVLLNWRPGP